MILVIDVGTTGLRASLVRPDATLASVEYRPFAPDSPFPGLIEFDASRMAELVLDAAHAVLHRAGDPLVAGVGITNQRASTIVWDRATGVPIAPALGWQDLRTVGECITAKVEHGIQIAPNQSVTKIGWLLANASAGRDPAELCFGTVDTWLAWTLSQGALHVTDHSNAAVTGLYAIENGTWHAGVCELLGVPEVLLPTIVDTAGIVGAATALPGAPPIAALVGDQQASLAGQGCTTPGLAKITFGTGGMLDVCHGSTGPADGARSANGTFPIVAWSIGGERTWGAEAIMLSAGTNVEWLRDDMGLIATSEESHEVASRCEHTDGVVYVPALLGLGTPHWDYGARGTLLGLTRGTDRAHIVRAVLEGVAHRGADLVDAAETDTGLEIPVLRIDGGMSRNPTFVQALADASGKPVEVSPVVEATTLGAGYLAGVATGVWPDLAATSEQWQPNAVVEPGARLDRAVWAEAVTRASSWIPELSALDF
jgi:glycerol kinase